MNVRSSKEVAREIKTRSVAESLVVGAGDEYPLAGGRRIRPAATVR